MTLAAGAGLVLFAFTVEASSKSEQALNLLASWAATESEPIAAETSDRDGRSGDAQPKHQDPGSERRSASRA